MDIAVGGKVRKEIRGVRLPHAIETHVVGDGVHRADTGTDAHANSVIDWTHVGWRLDVVVVVLNVCLVGVHTAYVSKHSAQSNDFVL